MTTDEAEKLEWIRKHIRNVYMHGQTPHWLKDKDAEVVVGNLETGEANDESIKVRDNLAVQRQLRIIADRNTCDQVIRLVDRLVRTFTARSIEKIEAWKAKNASSPTKAQVDRVLENMKRQGLQADTIIINEFPPDMPRPGSTASG